MISPVSRLEQPFVAPRLLAYYAKPFSESMEYGRGSSENVIHIPNLKLRIWAGLWAARIVVTCRWTMILLAYRNFPLAAIVHCGPGSANPLLASCPLVCRQRSSSQFKSNVWSVYGAPSRCWHPIPGYRYKWRCYFTKNPIHWPKSASPLEIEAAAHSVVRIQNNGSRQGNKVIIGQFFFQQILIN